MPMLNVFDQGGVRLDAPAIVWATALFPNQNEVERRADVIAHEHFLSRQRGTIDHIPQEYLFRLAEAGRRSGATIATQIEKRSKKGVRVGRMACELLRELVADSSLASLNSASVVVANVERPEQRAAGIASFARHMAERDWKLLRPAAHLWGALYCAENWDPWAERWNSPDGLFRLLDIAELIRRPLATITPRNARRPVLAADLTWRIPCGFLNSHDVFVPELSERIRQWLYEARAES